MMTDRQTKVVIIGGGPAGLLLSQTLHLNDVDNVILERRSRTYVLDRIRAGVLEQGLVDMLDQVQVSERLHAEGEVHTGCNIGFRDELCRIDLEHLTDGKAVTVYGQTELTRDLYEARDAMGGVVIHEAHDIELHDLDTDNPYVTYNKDGRQETIRCAFVAGCDGFHGISRQTIPAAERRDFERLYPFGWLGVLSATPPVAKEVLYVSHDDGFALCSLRSRTLSRYYVQCSRQDRTEDWSDDRFWEQFQARLPAEVASVLVTGPSIEKSITPLRSFVSEPMSWNRLFLAGDAAHIVPPTGAKGLNLAASDVYYLSRALTDYFHKNEEQSLARYSETALARVWKAERFSWWMTMLLHQFPENSAFDERIQQAEFDYLVKSSAAQKVLAENYVGLPY